MRIKESELVVNPDGRVYHLNLAPQELADRVILVGDPARVSRVAAHFDTVELRRENREIHSCTGVYRGKRFTVLSTGMGPDNIDIVLNELDALKNIDLNTREIKPQKTSLEIVRIPLADPSANDKLERFAYRGMRLTNYEMETSAIYGLSALLGHRACSTNCIVAARTEGVFSKDAHAAVDRLIAYVLDRLARD